MLSATGLTASLNDVPIGAQLTKTPGALSRVGNGVDIRGAVPFAVSEQGEHSESSGRSVRHAKPEARSAPARWA